MRSLENMNYYNDHRTISMMTNRTVGIDRNGRVNWGFILEFVEHAFEDHSWDEYDLKLSPELVSYWSNLDEQDKRYPGWDKLPWMAITLDWLRFNFDEFSGIPSLKRMLEIVGDDGELFWPKTNLETGWIICPDCQGDGKFVNPSIDCGGVCEDDYDFDWDGYTSGRYDTRCGTCEPVNHSIGTGKIRVLSSRQRGFSKWLQETVDQRNREAQGYARERARELAWGY